MREIITLIKRVAITFLHEKKREREREMSRSQHRSVKITYSPSLHLNKEMLGFVRLFRRLAQSGEELLIID